MKKDIDDPFSANFLANTDSHRSEDKIVLSHAPDYDESDIQPSHFDNHYEDSKGRECTSRLINSKLIYINYKIFMPKMVFLAH